MNTVAGLRCLRCGEVYPQDLSPDQLVSGCPQCGTSTSISNLTIEYEPYIWDDISHKTFKGRSQTLWRYYEFLPVDLDYAVSINEGGTDLVECQRLAAHIGVERLFIKDESRNPTWSHKDRAMSVGISRARQVGARVVTTSSSGNEGGALAAYAARAGLEAVVFTSAACPDTMRTLMQVFGAKVIATPTSKDRFTIMQQCVENLGWYPLSSFGSILIGINPYSIEGYKTIAYEICEALNFSSPDIVIVPTCWGDGLQGIWKGFKEFKRCGLIDKLPRMVAAEVFGPLTNAIEMGLDYVAEMPTGDSIAISIAAGVSTWQALNVLRESGGIAQDVVESDLLPTQLLVASKEGVFAEASSIVSIAALKRIVEEGGLEPGATVVCVNTSTGLKDPSPTRQLLPEVPLIEPTMEALEQVMKDKYGKRLEDL